MQSWSSYRARVPAGAVLWLTALAVGLTASDVPHLKSVLRNHDITVDGANTEWDTLDVLPDGPAFGAANDDQNLYVIVSTSDQEIRQQLSRGAVLWFDATGGKKQTFGIGLPAAPTDSSSAVDDAPKPAEGTLITPSAPRTPVIGDFDVYGPGKNERHLVRLEKNLGVEISAALREGTLIYELKLPLAKTEAHPYAVGAVPGSTVGLGLTTEAPPADRSGRSGGFRRSGRRRRWLRRFWRRPGWRWLRPGRWRIGWRLSKPFADAPDDANEDLGRPDTREIGNDRTTKERHAPLARHLR